MSNRTGTGTYRPEGLRFGKLTTTESCRTVARRVRCLCDCGGVIFPTFSNLLNGSTKSCGCLNVGSPPRHGMAMRGQEHPVWMAWKSMVQRCSDPHAQNYERYGGRGIAVCERWQTFENFRDDMLGSWSKGMTLERKDVDGPYNKDNCTWIPAPLQARNRRTTRWVTIKGQRMSLAEAVERFAVMSKRTTLARIYELGWGVEEALFTGRR